MRAPGRRLQRPVLVVVDADEVNSLFFEVRRLRMKLRAIAEFIRKWTPFLRWCPYLVEGDLEIPLHGPGPRARPSIIVALEEAEEHVQNILETATEMQELRRSQEPDYNTWPLSRDMMDV
jgi:hypothetical protein